MVSPEARASYYRARYYDSPTGRFLSADPFEFSVGPNFYSYVSNSPLGFSDPMGLSQKDVQRILKRAQDSTDELTKHGERVDPGDLNNIRWIWDRLFPPTNRMPTLGCGQQAQRVQDDIEHPNLPYDDGWSFKVIPVNRGTHQIGVAHSDNPNDPDIIFDPWNNQFFTVPHGWKPRT